MKTNAKDIMFACECIRACDGWQTHLREGVFPDDPTLWIGPLLHRIEDMATKMIEKESEPSDDRIALLKIAAALCGLEMDLATKPEEKIFQILEELGILWAGEYGTGTIHLTKESKKRKYA